MSHQVEATYMYIHICILIYLFKALKHYYVAQSHCFDRLTGFSVEVGAQVARRSGTSNSDWSRRGLSMGQSRAPNRRNSRPTINMYSTCSLEYIVCLEYMVYGRYRDPTKHDFWYPPYIEPWNQNTRSLRLCGLLRPYRHLFQRSMGSPLRPIRPT